MPVGYCLLEMRLPENESLKGRRNLLRSVTQRVRSKYNVAIAEIGGHDSWQMVSLGISCVSTSSPHCHEVLEKVVDFVQETRLDAELLDYSIEIIHP
jgi:uncharacterized protein YlxP (DUF503 family)